MKNRSAEEIFRRYIRGFWLLRALRWVGCLVCLVLVLPRVWREESAVGTAVIFFLYVLYLYGLRLVNSLRFLSLNLILNRDCDAVKFTQVSRLLQEHLGRKSTGMARLNVAQGLYWSGRFEEAEAELEQVRLKKKLTAAIHSMENLRFNCCIQRGDLFAAQAVREKVEKDAREFRKGSLDQKNAERLLLVMDGALALQREDWEAYRTIHAQLETGTNLQEVSAAWHLAKVELALGQREKAIDLLRFASEQGGTLYIAAGAKRMLGQLS